MTFDALQLAAAPVTHLSPYVPGKPLSELEREYGITHSIKLASNENPLGPGPKARAAIDKAINTLGLYPDGNGFELRQTVARLHHCDIKQVTLGNGSNDLLVMLAEAFLTSAVEAVYSQYCFAVYPLAVQATGAVARQASANADDHAMPLGHDLAAMQALVNERTRLVFIANPNNPIGTWVDYSALQQFLAAMPATTLVVIDEAYVEYAPPEARVDVTHWLREFPNLVVLRTLSKAHGLAGLRVGYALSHPSVADVLNRIRQPFNVNSVALAAGAAALQDDAHLQATLQLNSQGLQQLQLGLTALKLRVYPSRANFVLVDCGRPGFPVYEALLRQGVIVRPVGGYGLPNHLRISIGTHSENARLLQALAQVLQAA